MEHQRKNRRRQKSDVRSQKVAAGFNLRVRSSEFGVSAKWFLKSPVRRFAGSPVLKEVPRPAGLISLIAHCSLLIALTINFFGCQAGYTANPKTEQKKTEAAQKKPEPPPKFNIGDFVYTSENKRDPFEPIYLTKLKESKREKASTVKKGYELAELKLVGILMTDKNKFIMMEDVQGRGINFKKGDFLNNNLWIVDIVGDKVIFGYKLKGEEKKFTIDIPRK